MPKATSSSASRFVRRVRLLGVSRLAKLRSTRESEERELVTIGESEPMEWELDESK